MLPTLACAPPFGNANFSLISIADLQLCNLKAVCIQTSLRILLWWETHHPPRQILSLGMGMSLKMLPLLSWNTPCSFHRLTSQCYLSGTYKPWPNSYLNSACLPSRELMMAFMGTRLFLWLFLYIRYYIYLFCISQASDLTSSPKYGWVNNFWGTVEQSEFKKDGHAHLINFSSHNFPLLSMFQPHWLFVSF